MELHLPILFVDPRSVKAYDHLSLQEDVLGGTEATVVRVAEKLSESVPVVVVQLSRQSISYSQNVTYAPLLTKYFQEKWQAIIFLRNLGSALNLYKSFQKAPTWIWMHDLINLNLMPFIKGLMENQIGIISVSDFHKQQVLELYKVTKTTSVFPKVKRIYNPIDDDLIPDDTPVNPNKLIYISSPYKGVWTALELFQQAKKLNNNFELYITNPSYHDHWKIQAPGVINLGPRIHADNIKEIRNSLAVFYPGNPYFVETFGLVFAESNAVGTPVLTYSLGAAREVLNGESQLVEINNVSAFLNKLMEWHQGARPVVKAKEEFRLSKVIQDWKRLLTDENF